MVVDKLRQNGLNIVTANNLKKVGDQIKYADKLKIPYVLCIGPKELSSDKFVIKELSTGKETELSRDEIAGFFKE